MLDFQSKTSDEKVNKELIKQLKQFIKEHEDIDKMFRFLLKQNWKDKKMIGNLTDAIKINTEVIEEWKNEIKERNSRIITE